MQDGSRLAGLVEEGDRFLDLVNAVSRIDRSPSLGAPLLRRALGALAEIQALAQSPDYRGPELPDLSAALAAETLLDAVASGDGDADVETTRRYQEAVADAGRALGALRESLGLPVAGRGATEDTGGGAYVTWRFVVAAFLAPFVLVSLWWVLFRSSDAPKQLEFSPDPPVTPAPAPVVPPAASSAAPAAVVPPPAGGEAPEAPVPVERISPIGLPVNEPVGLVSAADGVFHRFLVSSGPSGRYDVRVRVGGSRCVSSPSEDAFASLIVRIDGQQIAVVTPRSEKPEETAIRGVSLGVGSRLDLVMSGDFAISGKCDRNLSVELRSISASGVQGP